MYSVGDPEHAAVPGGLAGAGVYAPGWSGVDMVAYWEVVGWTSVVSRCGAWRVNASELVGEE